MSVEDIVVITEVSEITTAGGDIVVAFDPTPSVVETDETGTVISQEQEIDVIVTPDETATVLTEGTQGPPGVNGSGGSGVFIVDVTSITGIVGSKVFDADTVPPNATIVSCVTDTPLVRVLVAADGGTEKYSPDVTVNSLPVTLTESSTKRWFTGTVDVPIGAGTTVLTAVSGGATDTAAVTLAGAGPTVTSVTFGAYPGSQTALKSGDSLSVTVVTEITATSVTLSGPVTTAILSVTAGTATGTLTMNGATGTPTLTAIAKNSLGTAGASFTSGTVTMDQTYPTFSAFSKTYPASHTALDIGESVVIGCTVSGADTYSYSGGSLTVPSPTAYAATKTVTHSATGYTTLTYSISATRAANNATASASTPVLVATVAPTASMGATPSGRMTSSPVGITYTVRITPDQTLLSAPSANASIGAWQGSWTLVGGVWQRGLLIADADARGTGVYSTLSLTGPSGIAGSTITSGGTYSVGGFSSRTLTFAAFSRVAALGVAVATPAKLTAQIVGGNVLALQANNSVVASGFYPAAADGSYSASGTYMGLSDSAFAGSNTSGTLQATIAEAA